MPSGNDLIFVFNAAIDKRLMKNLNVYLIAEFVLVATVEEYRSKRCQILAVGIQHSQWIMQEPSLPDFVIEFR